MKLILEKLNKSFGSKQVLKDISFEFEKGRIYGILGRNGIGKTTLFNCLSKEIETDSGRAYLTESGQETLLGPDNMGYVFSTAILPEFLTGYEFIKFYLEVNRNRIDDNKTIEEYFDMIKIGEADQHQLIKNYSLGMKNKIQLLMTIILKPFVILLDEPLSSLDVVVSLEMKNFLKSVSKDHIIIITTHILQLAIDLCDEIVVFNHGRLSTMDPELLKNDKLENELIAILSEA